MDFFHGTEHVGTLAAALDGQVTLAAQAQWSRLEKQLLRNGVRDIIAQGNAPYLNRARDVSAPKSKTQVR